MMHSLYTSEALSVNLQDSLPKRMKKSIQDFILENYTPKDVKKIVVLIHFNLIQT